MACGVELESSELPPSIPCAQPIIKLLKLIWSAAPFANVLPRNHAYSSFEFFLFCPISAPAPQSQ